MTYGNNILDFYYNAHGTPILLNCNGNLFYYITNLQGDVIRLVDIYGNIAAMYQYDPYGNVIQALGSHSQINPLRYRGYYYDNELGMYYLQSRYYDPKIGRFINADAYASTGQGFIGYNMFAYCGNNPILYIDATGTAYTPGQIHNFVVKEICDNDPNKESEDTYMRYKEPIKKYGRMVEYGYCDIYDTVTHEIWEVKRLRGGTGCSNKEAMKQLINYVVNGVFEHRDDVECYVGGTYSTIPMGWFTVKDNDGQGTYVIAYWDASHYGVDGIVHYDYYYLPSGGEAVTTVAIGLIIVGAIAMYGIPGGIAAGGVLAPT